MPAGAPVQLTKAGKLSGIGWVEKSSLVSHEFGLHELSSEQPANVEYALSCSNRSRTANDVLMRHHLSADWHSPDGAHLIADQRKRMF